MSSSLQASGKYPVSGLFSKGPSPQDWLEKVQEWLEKHEAGELVHAGIVEGAEGPVLLAQLHPAGDPVSFSAPGLGLVDVTASAQLVGPGFQLHLLDLLDAMAADLGVTWMSVEDTAGPASRTLRDVEASLAQLLAEDVRALLSADAPEPPHSLLPLAGETFLHAGFVATALGPRDRAWAERAATGDPLAARDAWSWRHASRDAAYHRDRALSVMWTDLRWGVMPEGDEPEIQAEVAERLAKAHSMDESLTMPWREWAEILPLVEHDEKLLADVRSRATGAAGQLAGYRRGDVLMGILGPFTVRLPGRFRSDVDEDGTWSATDGERAMHVAVRQAPSRGEIPGSAAPLLAHLELEGEHFTHQAEGLLARAALRQDVDEDTNEELWVLSCGIAAGPLLARATITYADPADRPWALDTWRSIATRQVREARHRGGAPGITG